MESGFGQTFWGGMCLHLLMPPSPNWSEMSGPKWTLCLIVWFISSACTSESLGSNTSSLGLPWWLRGWRVSLQCGRPGFDSWVRKIPWRRKWQSTPVFLPGKSHGQRGLVGDSPWGHTKSQTRLSDFTFQVNPRPASCILPRTGSSQS